MNFFQSVKALITRENLFFIFEFAAAISGIATAVIAWLVYYKKKFSARLVFLDYGNPDQLGEYQIQLTNKSDDVIYPYMAYLVVNGKKDDFIPMRVERGSKLEPLQHTKFVGDGEIIIEIFEQKKKNKLSFQGFVILQDERKIKTNKVTLVKPKAKLIK